MIRKWDDNVADGSHAPRITYKSAGHSTYLLPFHFAILIAARVEEEERKKKIES